MRRFARLLVIAGTILAVVGLSKVHAAWIADDPYDYTGSFRFAWSLTYVGLLLIASYGAGLPDLANGARGAVLPSAAALLFSALSISVLQLVTGDALLPRFVVFGAAVVLVPWNLVCAALASGARRRAEGREGVVVVASPDAVDELVAELHADPERHAHVVAALTPEEALPAGRGERPLVDVVVAEGAALVALDRDAQASEAIVAQAAALHESGVRIRTLSLFYEQWLGKLPVAELERVSLMFDIGEIHRARYSRAKRVVDVAIGVAGLAVLAAMTPLVAVGNLLGNRGPLLYRQERVGRWGRSFSIVKFRTMTPHDGERPNEWTSADDPRITPFGRVLRRLHLDELPQLVNVLRGDLSIIGPRPEQTHYVEELQVKIPFYDLRHSVRPGLTGWAQVKYGYAGDERDALQKLQYDFYYLRHQGLRLDAKILARTVRAVLGGGGR